MDTSTIAIGYLASAASLLGFSAQLVHTMRSQTIAGLSISRTTLDVVGLALWICYATRLEDIPLLIATSFELLASMGIFVVVLRHRCGPPRIKDITPPNSSPTSSPTRSEEDIPCVIEVRPRSHTLS